jgi:hypothetical protein
MNVSTTPASTMAMAAASQQLQAVMETQMALLQELAENQQEVAQMLAASGIGQAIDIQA